MNMLTKLRLLAAVTMLGTTVPAQAGPNEDLIAACMQGNLEAAKKAVDGGANLNFVSPQGTAAVNAAIFWPEIEQYLIGKGADVNAGKNNALTSAATFGAGETVKLLLAANADPNKGTEVNMGAIFQQLIDAEKAKPKPNGAMIKAYEGQMAKVGTNSYTYALTSAVNGANNAEVIALLLAKGAKTDKAISAPQGGSLFIDYGLTAQSAEDRAALYRANAPNIEKAGFKLPDWYKSAQASQMSSPDAIVKALVKGGVNVNGHLGSTAVTPLNRYLAGSASKVTREDIVLALLSNGADFNAASPAYGHPLLKVAGYGFTEALKYMLDHGAKLDQDFKFSSKETGEDLKGVTPVMYAALNNHLETVKLLVARGADLSQKAEGTIVDPVKRCYSKVKDKSAIYFAIDSGNPEMVQYLWENGKQDWKAHNMRYESVTVVQNTVTTHYASCRNDLKPYTPAAYAKDAGNEAIAAWVKSK